jgi:hypothetical protein
VVGKIGGDYNILFIWYLSTDKKNNSKSTMNLEINEDEINHIKTYSYFFHREKVVKN